MNFKEMLAKARKKYEEKLAAQKSLYQLTIDEARELTEEETKSFDDMQKEMDALATEMKRLESVIVADGFMGEEADPATAKTLPVSFETQGEKKDDGGFKSIGEFIHAVRFGDKSGRLEALQKELEQKDASPTSMDEFGFMMPPALHDQIMQLPTPTNIVRPRAMVLPAGSPPDSSIVIPALDQTGDAGNIFGGVEVSWIEEGEFKPETNIKLTSITITPYELAASMRVTDKALRNFTALSPLITRNLGGALLDAEDLAFISGHGDEGLTGTDKKQPLGVLKSTALVKIKREVANQISYPDIIKMEKQMLPNSRANAVWIIDNSRFDQIQLLQDPSGKYIFGTGDATQGRPDTLRGRPIVWTDKVASGGTVPAVADIGLYDLGYYVIKDGFGPVIQASPHPYFQNNVTVIKIFTNVGGKPWLKKALKLRNGMEVSPFVVLDIPKA